MKYLIVKRPYVDQLLDGTKPVEFRSRRTNVRGIVGLIASGEKGNILGMIDLFDCTKLESGWGWHMRNPVRFVFPQRFAQKLGCVIWCNS